MVLPNRGHNLRGRNNPKPATGDGRVALVANPKFAVVVIIAALVFSNP